MINRLYDIKNLSFGYGNQPILKNISASFEKGKFFGILGPNGCGKTTFLDLLVGHKAPEKGEILFSETPLHKISKKKLSKQVALVSQNFYINFPYKVEEIVMMGRYPHIPRFSMPDKTDFYLCDHAMETTGVFHLRDKLVTELSGGERQRTVFARALAQDTEILLLDEATSNLDISHSIYLLNTVKKKVQEKQLTVISVFQDINLAAIFCDNLIFMKDGHVLKQGTTEEMMDESILWDVFHINSKIRFEPLYQAKQAIFETGKEVVAWS